MTLRDRYRRVSTPIRIIHNGVKRLVNPLPEYYGWRCSGENKFQKQNQKFYNDYTKLQF